MLKVALLCGGSGGKALQAGFDCLFEYGNYKLDAIINAYDDGKSTGVCRNIFNRKILGPSDLRKNQITQFKLKYKKELEDKNSKQSKLIDLFELRFSAENYQEYYEVSKKLIENIDYCSLDTKRLFLVWLDYFFYENGKLRKGIEEVLFKDFSLSNIFYASCAAISNNSLEKAGMMMSEILNIEDRVHVVSDVNLFLTAKTESGKILKDEGTLVSWNNPEDKVIEAILRKENGEYYIPSVNEGNTKDIVQIIKDADLLILSSGTQWSSLIPTYMHKGMKDLLNSCKAKKYLVMNNKEDLDSKGACANDLLDIISKFIDLKDVKVVLNDNADESMNHICDAYTFIHGVLSDVGDSKHNPKEVVKLIMKDYYGLDKDYDLVSDLDGTLYDEKLEDKTICKKNFDLFKGIILSGNNYKHVYEIVKDYYHNRNENYIYCNYGNTIFKLDNPREGEVLSHDYAIEEDVLNELKKYDAYKDKLTVRGEAILTIRPLQNRNEKLIEINSILAKLGNKYKALVAGHTTIDIIKKDYSKLVAYQKLLKKENIQNDVIYIGDGFKDGNDTCMLKSGAKIIEVKDVWDTYAFLRSFYS